MNIVLDIGHPAHVHFFKHFIWEMEKRGHNILITASDKDVALKLLKAYGFECETLGSYGRAILKKIVNIPLLDVKMLKSVCKRKPDLFIGISPVRSSHVAAILGKPCIAFDDTEHSKYEIMLYKPFVKAICTPRCFIKNLGKKQIRYDGYHELAYLHPAYFKPDPSILQKIGLKKNDKYAIVRFVSWNAYHDVGHHGFCLDDKHTLISELNKYCKVFISSESPLPDEFLKYQIKLPPENMHDLLYYASLYIGEGGTMATEAALLGTPSICVSTLSLNVGNFFELNKKYDLLYSYADATQAIAKANVLLNTEKVKEQWAVKRSKLLSEKIDVTKFMIDIVEKQFNTVRDKSC